MSVNEYLIDSASRHAVFIQRYSGGQAKEAKKLLNRLRREILARLADEPTQFRADRLNRLLVDIDNLAKETFGEVTTKFTDEAKKFANQELDFTNQMVDKVTDRADFTYPADAQLTTALINRPMDAKLVGSKMTIQQALNQFGKVKGAEIARTISDSALLGDTTPEIANKVSTLMKVKHSRQAESLVRTVLNHASSVARDEFYAENANILDGYEWVSTLDASTSNVCMARDGKIYKRGGPVPPAHFQCRSTTIPVVNEKFTVAKLNGMRPQKGDKTGRTSAKSTYGSWLKKQSKEFQDKALGPERAALFRSGKIKIDQFVDPTGETYTLDQLRSLYPLAFE